MLNRSNPDFRIKKENGRADGRNASGGERESTERAMAKDHQHLSSLTCNTEYVMPITNVTVLAATRKSCRFPEGSSDVIYICEVISYHTVLM